MQKLRSILQIIYYLIWIPLGILLLALIIFLIVANPIGRFLDSFSLGGGPGGSFPGPPGSDQGGFGSSGGFSSPPGGGGSFEGQEGGQFGGPPQGGQSDRQGQ